MSLLRALAVYGIEGTTSFEVLSGTFYLVDATAGDVTAYLPSSATTQAGDWVVIKKTDQTSHAVNIVPWKSEPINGTTINVLSAPNQSHSFFPSAPDGGWTSI